MAHPDGEVAVAKAAAAYNNTALLLSSWASSTMEDVALVAPNSVKML